MEKRSRNTDFPTPCLEWERFRTRVWAPLAASRVFSLLSVSPHGHPFLSIKGQRQCVRGGGGDTDSQFHPPSLLLIRVLILTSARFVPDPPPFKPSPSASTKRLPPQSSAITFFSV